jgi:hypothetical protein
MASQAPPPPPPQQQQQKAMKPSHQQQQQQPAAPPQAQHQLRKPVFVTVDQLQPGSSGHNLVVKVVNTKLVVQRSRPNPANARQVRIAECLVGDQTGVIVFTARNDQGTPSSAILHASQLQGCRHLRRVDSWNEARCVCALCAFPFCV